MNWTSRDVTAQPYKLHALSGRQQSLIAVQERSENTMIEQLDCVRVVKLLEHTRVVTI